MDERAEIADAFNYWLEQYTHHPEQFRHMWQVVEQHIAEKNAGKPLSYGEVCADLLSEYRHEARKQQHQEPSGRSDGDAVESGQTAE